MKGAPLPENVLAEIRELMHSKSGKIAADKLGISYRTMHRMVSANNHAAPATIWRLAKALPQFPELAQLAQQR